MSAQKEGRSSAGFVLAVLAMSCLLLAQFTPPGGSLARFMTICTSQGFKTVAVENQSQAPAPSHENAAVKHCPLCMLRAVSLLTPVAVAMPLPRPATSRVMFHAGGDRSVSQFQFHPLQARAPPVFL